MSEVNFYTPNKVTHYFASTQRGLQSFLRYLESYPNFGHLVRKGILTSCIANIPVNFKIMLHASWDLNSILVGGISDSILDLGKDGVAFLGYMVPTKKSLVHIL